MQDQSAGDRRNDTEKTTEDEREATHHPAGDVDPEAPPHTTSRLRGDIDEGRAGDKVAFPDPSASPLGTDAEAGGTSPTTEEVARAQANETQGRPQAPEPSGARPVSSAGADGRRGRGVTTIAVLAGVVVLIILVSLFA